MQYQLKLLGFLCNNLQADFKIYMKMEMAKYCQDNIKEPRRGRSGATRYLIHYKVTEIKKCVIGVKSK